MLYKSGAKAVEEKLPMTIMMAGYAGLSGTAALFDDERALSVLEKKLSGGFLERVRFCSRKMVKEEQMRPFSNTGTVYPADRRGFFSCLWDLWEESRTGFVIDMNEVPVCQETIEVCELLERSPYEVESEGCFLLVTQHPVMAQEIGEQTGVVLRAIGRTTKEKAKKLVKDGRVRFLDKPGRDRE